MHNLHCNSLGNTFQCQQQKHSELKAKIHNLKWFLFHWNFKVLELLFTCIYLSLASFSVLLKHKLLRSVKLNLFLHNVSIFWLEPDITGTLYFAQTSMTSVKGARNLAKNKKHFPRSFLMQQIYRRTPITMCDFNKVALQRYWNRTSSLVFFGIFAAYFQNIFL